MSLHLGIRRRGKHHPDEVIATLRVQLAGAGDRIGYLQRALDDTGAKRAEAEQVVVCLDADLIERTEERDQLQAELAAVRAQLAPYLAAEANAGAVTVPEMVRDTSAIEDQATAPIDVRPLWAALGDVVATPGSTDPAHLPA